MLQIQAHIALVGSGMGVALVPRDACRDTFDKVKFLMIEGAQSELGIALALRQGPQIQTATNFRSLVLKMRDEDLFTPKRRARRA
jgi:DNA-binding transcriptional LysR family regulator